MPVFFMDTGEMEDGRRKGRKTELTEPDYRKPEGWGPKNRVNSVYSYGSDREWIFARPAKLLPPFLLLLLFMYMYFY